MQPQLTNFALLMELTRTKTMNVERFEAAAYQALVWEANGLPEGAGDVRDLSLRVTPVTVKEGGRTVGIDVHLSGKIDGERATMNASFNFLDGPFWGVRSENLSSEMVRSRVPEDKDRGVRNVSLTEFEHPAVVEPGRAKRGEQLMRLFDASCSELLTREMALNDPFSQSTPDSDPIFQKKGVVTRVAELVSPSF
mgnify:CR=1 FL=1